MQIISTLAQVAEKVFESKDLATAKLVFVNHVGNTKVKDKDKMINEVNKMTSLMAVQRYTANALLKYEGLGVSKPKNDNAPVVEEN
jgi:hypothetical protein